MTGVIEIETALACVIGTTIEIAGLIIANVDEQEGRMELQE